MSPLWSTYPPDSALAPTVVWAPPGTILHPFCRGLLFLDGIRGKLWLTFPLARAGDLEPSTNAQRITDGGTAEKS